MKKKKQFLIIIGSFVSLYIVEFLILPTLFPQYYPKTSEAENLFYILFFLMTVIEMFAISNFFLFYIIGMVIQMLLIWIYPAKGAYGLGWSNPILNVEKTIFSRETLLFEMMCVYALFLMFTFIIWILVSIIKYIVKKVRNKRKKMY